MPPAATNRYAQWREESGLVPELREDGAAPPERLLQAIWQHQRLHRDRLRTLDGQPVLVLHPGFANPEGGPDFREALLRIGEAPAVRGEVEVDLQAGGWRAHGHDRNPAFRNVILHVVWAADRATVEAAAARRAADRSAPQTAPGQRPPVLVIGDLLDAPLGELARWLGSEAARRLPANLCGRCSAAWRELSAERQTELLRGAALVRLQSKAARFAARARQVGWEQTLWEGLFRGLGYKHNVWPMQRLAELRPHWSAPEAGLLAIQARLFGLSGLLPADLTRAEAGTDRYLRRVWDHWWREQEALRDFVLPHAAWHLRGLRPANHPQRRLALAAHWEATGSLPARLEAWCHGAPERRGLPESLLRVLQAGRDDFWSRHWTFRAAPLPSPRPLLGATRATDLAINAVLPWLWARAVAGRNAAVRAALEARYLAWPAAEDNAVLRLARQRLLSGAAAGKLQGAAAQQGLLQIVQDFCDHTNAVCDTCPFPERVRAWQREEAPPHP